MDKFPLGQTGTSVSAVCLGILEFGSRIDKADSYHLLDRYVDAGGSFIDTANTYNRWREGFVGGESETILGQWMHQRRNRQEMFVATKVGFEYQDVPRSLRAHVIITECEKSLKRLQTDVIDLYYAHTDDRNTRVGETIEAFDRLVQAGKIRYAGASNFTAWRLEQARALAQMNGWSPYCCVQQRYTYLRAKPGTYFDAQVMADDNMLDYTRSTNISLLAFSPLLRGAYTRTDRQFPQQYLGLDTDARLHALKIVAEETGATNNQVVLAWMLHHNPPVIPVMAATTDAQMDQNISALDVKLNSDQMKRLNAAGA